MTLCWPCISKKIKEPINPSVAMVQVQAAFRTDADVQACMGVCDNCGKEDHGCRAPDRPKFTRKRP